MPTRMLALGALAAIQLGHGLRLTEDTAVLEDRGAEDPEGVTNDDDLLVDHGFCCCKDEPCSVEAKSDSGEIEAVYSPNQGTCCKMKKRRCGHWLQYFSGYKTQAPSENFCHPNRPQDQVYVQPQLEEWCASGIADPVSGTCCPKTCGTCGGEVGTSGCEGRPGGAACCLASFDCTGRYETGCKIPEDVPTATPQPLDNYEAGTVGHTVNNFCNFSGHVAHDPANEEGMVSAKHKIVRQIVEQLEDNSIDQLAKEMFTIYMCVRWVPTPEFVSMAESEIRTEQLEDRKVLDHYEDFTFMPMRCSENFAVYNRESLNATYFEKFESEMEAQAQWYDTESHGVFAKRLHDINVARSSSNKKKVEDLTQAFDLPYVKKKANCVSNQTQMSVDTFKASPEELLNDCAAAKWWLSKLSDWHRSMPFSTFMTPSKDVDEKARPGDDEQVMICYGKRVASELHRRAEGGHLMTDQTTVGCHGFYDFDLAKKMTERIVRLWRPPTCQLAALTLDFKVKILQMMEDLNDRLFDALPSLILEEETGMTNFDGTRLEPAGSMGVMAGIWKSIASRFNFFKTKYTRLGALLGGTTVKWVVCPLTAITNQTELDRLDTALGSEDHVSRYYSRIAYQHKTGDAEQLPGENCDTLPQLAIANKCPIGQLRVNMPEPYKNEEFMCPVVPLMPAKEQLQVFENKENTCILYMNSEQEKQHNWFHRGHHPSELQYNVTVNEPEAQYRTAKIMSYRRRPDSRLNLFRDWAQIGKWCNYAESIATPRWCQNPVILNNDMAHRNLLTNIPLPKFDGIPNHPALADRWADWFYRLSKGTERWFRRQSTEWAGRAKARYDKLYAKSFEEVEVNEMLHSMSFQEHLGDSGGDSKGRDTYQRYVITVPCQDFFPDNMFKMKYEWAEYGMQLMRKARNDWNKDDAVLGSKYFSVEIRGDAVLQMKDEMNAYITYWSHIRAFGYEKEKPQFVKTANPIVESLTGALDPSRYSRVRATDMRGFRATFACGGQVAMHNLDMKAIALKQVNSFQDCVNEGIETNKELRKNNPGATFLPDEVVVRMFISELPSCYKRVDTDMIQKANETENHVYSNFVKAVSDCKPVEGELPPVLEEATKSETFRGVLLGHGVPANTLEEVLMDPEDVKREVGL